MVWSFFSFYILYISDKLNLRVLLYFNSIFVDSMKLYDHSFHKHLNGLKKRLYLSDNETLLLLYVLIMFSPLHTLGWVKIFTIFWQMGMSPSSWKADLGNKVFLHIGKDTFHKKHIAFLKLQLSNIIQNSSN